jgi:hypothetical protein
MNLKPGVDMNGVQPEILEACAKIHHLMEATGRFTLTACLDGKHKEGSLHYKGFAVDIRSKHIPEEKKDSVLAAIKATLGRDYDVILEATHIHLEYDPKV